MKLAEYKDEKALDLLADLIEPLSEILADEDVRKAAEKVSRIRAVSVAIKKHTKAIMQMLATIEGVPVEEYHCNVFTLPNTLVEMLNDPDIAPLFISAGQRTEKKSSGSLTENTEAKEQ